MEHPLDSPKFSTVEFINNLLPTPSSLTNSNSKVIQNILTNLKSQINQVDTDLQTLVRNQIQLSVPLEEVSNLAPNLKTLVTRVDRVQNQAIQTEASVSEISKDIRALDFAKRNLTTCINFSRRLQMVNTAVDQLKLHAQNKQYREAGQLIQAVEQLFSHLTTFNNLKVIVELEKSIKNVKEGLIREILSQFQSSFNGLGKLAYPAEPLSEANTILDLIDPNARKTLITWYIDLQLQDYLSIFRGDDEVGALDNTSRRFAWLKRWFQMFDQEHSSIFPGDWHVDYKLAKKFCELTYGDLIEVLEKTASSNVNLVITSMQLTVAFEHQLDKRYSHLLMTKSDSFVSTISHCFIPYLKLYIKRENETLRDMIDQYKTQPLIADPEASIPVLSSSTKLFLFYSDTLTQLSKATNHQPLLELAQLLAKWLQTYLDQILISKLPNIEVGNYQLSNLDNDMRLLCLLLNTCQYCLETLKSFVDRLNQLIHPELVGQLQFTNIEANFDKLITNLVEKLSKLTDKSNEPIFNGLLQLNWDKIQTEIPIINDLKLELTQSFNLLNTELYRKKFLELYLINYSSLFFTRYLETILKLKRIINANTNVFKKTGEELRKVYLECVKNLGLYSNTQTFEQTLKANYISSFLTFYNLLEIQIPENLDPTAETTAELVNDWIDKFLAWSPEGSISKFIKVMQLKGIPKQDQGPFREKLAERVPSKSSSLSIAVTVQPPASGFESGEASGAKGMLSPTPMSSSSNYSQSKLNQNFQNFFKGMSLRREPSSNN